MLPYPVGKFVTVKKLAQTEGLRFFHKIYLGTFSFHNWGQYLVTRLDDVIVLTVAQIFPGGHMYLNIWSF